MSTYDERIVRYEEIHDVKETDFKNFISAIGLENITKVLDCGCGYGACTNSFLKEYCVKGIPLDIDLVDESLAQINRAKAELNSFIGMPKINLNFLKNNIPEDFSIKNKYELAFAKMVLHEVPLKDQAKFFSTIQEALKPGGVLLLWDFVLEDDLSRIFAAEIIKKKDELAKYNLLVQRRHFNTAKEINNLLKNSGFTLGRKHTDISSVLDTEKRLIPEFGNNKILLSQWHDFIREKASKCTPDFLKHINYEDKGQTIRFTFNQSIYRAEKGGNRNFVLRPFGTSGFDIQNSKEDETFQKIFENCNQLIPFVKELLPNKGLLRPTVIVRSGKERNVICPGSFEYLYNYDDLPQDWTSQAESFLAYLAWTKCADMSNFQEITYMSALINQALLSCSSAAYFLVKSEGPNKLRLRLGTISDVAEETVVTFSSSIKDFFDAVIKKMSQMSMEFDGTVVSSAIKRYEILIRGERYAYDLAANKLAKEFDTIRTDIINAARVVEEKQIHINQNINGLGFIIKHWDLLLPLCEYLERSNSKYCYYLVPPSLLIHEKHEGQTIYRRLEEGILILTTTEELTPEVLFDSINFTSGLWAGLGAVDAKLTERHLQKAQLQKAMAANVYSIGHVLKTRFSIAKSPLNIAKELLTKTKIKKKIIDQQIETSLQGIDENIRISNVMDMFSKTTLNAKEVHNRNSDFETDTPFFLGKHLSMEIDRFNKVEMKMKVVKKEPKIIEKLIVDTINGKRYFDPFYEILLYELLYNAFTHSPPDKRHLEIEFSNVNVTGGDKSEKLNCLILSNPVRAQDENWDKKVGLEENKWTLWPGGKGLQLLQNWLEVTHTGVLLATASKRSTQWWAHFGLALNGLKILEK